MASIRTRKGKRGPAYQVLYRDRAGVQHAETFAREADARARKSEVEVEVRKGTYIPPNRGRITFGEMYAKWEKTRRVSKTRTAADRCYAKGLPDEKGRGRPSARRGGHVFRRWEKTRLEDIAYTDVEAWVTELGDKLAPATVARCLTLLKLPLDAAVKDGRLAVNPAAAVKPPKVIRPRKRSEDVLTAKELHTLAAYVSRHYRALVLVAGWLGPRWGEAIAIRRRHVNPLKKTITLGESVIIEITGHTEEKTGAKTEESTARVVPLPQPLLDALNEHIATVCPDAGSDDYLFRTAHGTAPLRSNFARKTLTPALKAAGLAGRGITFHRLRHTAASLMLDAGLDVQDVQERLGHASPSTTMDIYKHLLKKRRDEGTEALERAIAEAAAAE